MGYKETLHMMQTPFPMRAGLAEKEPVLVKRWQEEKLYEKMNANRENCPVFMLHDGPPYANGDMHCGHALNRCLKDFVLRYKNMSGYRTPFVFGWDSHGLPIEVKVTKSGVDRKATPVPEFRKICESYAKGQVEHQKGQIMRLGCLGDYANPYLTLLPAYEAKQIEVFAAMAEKGLIFKGLKPVYWSWSSESALAEAEVEYADVTAKTMYVAFPVKEGKGIIPNDASIIIWTTTPWTIPSNQGITVNPAFDYGLFATEKGKFVFLASLKDKLQSELGFERCDLLKTFKGAEIEGAKAIHPLYPSKESLVMNASFVTSDSGTGCVHTDPDHGLDDYNTCLKYGLKPQETVDEKGIMHFAPGDPWDGVFYQKCDDLVIKALSERGYMLKEQDLIHSYPHDWRTHKPVIFRATPQWFCSISPIREQLLEEIKKISWIPSWGEEKMRNMIKDRADWCISRQRVWGVPLPIIYNEDGSPIIDDAVFKHIESLIARYGSNVWFEKEAKDLLPEGYANPKSPHGAFTKEKDIMDVWFDSGSSWNGVLEGRGMPYPADLYLEGNDQYRGWFNSSLILSLAVNGVSPFKACLTHGFVMTEDWQKMSKSAGNGIDPNKIANQYGADILRLWAASVDYHSDVRIGERIIATTADNYRKIRNTFRFLLGNLNGYDPSSIETPSYSLIDRFILAEEERVKDKALDCYERYDFAGVANALIAFMCNDLSSFYLDISKDVLYCDPLSSPRRKAICAVIYKCCKDLCLLLNPILPFTMEEVYSYLPGEKKESPQLEDMPKKSACFDSSCLEGYANFKKIRLVANKALEEARQSSLIGSNGDASLALEVSDPSLLLLLKGQSEDDLSKYFLVSHLSLKEGEEDKAAVSVDPSPICPRCRNHVDSLEGEGEDALCSRCRKAIEEEKA